MISLTKIIDPLSGYIAKVQKDVSDRDKDRQQASPRLTGAATLLSAEDAVQAAYVNRLTAEINEIRSGISNMRSGLNALNIASSAYEDVLNVLERMGKKISEAQAAEDNNQALVSDSVSLASAISSFGDEVTAIISKRQLNEQNLIDGTFTNRVFPMWSGQSDPASISIENVYDTMASFRTFSALALAGGLEKTGTNITASKTITINGPDGTNTFDQLAGESASSLAARINVLEASANTAIGVSASARSTLRLNDLTNAGTVALSLASEKQGMGSVNISGVSIADKNDLSELAIAVNGYSDVTGIFAKMGATNNDIILTDPNGGNIGISSFVHSVSDTSLSVSVDRRDGITDFLLEGQSVDYNDVDAGFAGGSLNFGMVGNLTSENINLATFNVGDTSIGSVSIDANKNIFIGTGGGQAQIGAVDATNDGVGGNSLQINFNANSRVFTNGTFDTDSNWTKVSSQIISGTTAIDGLTTQRDTSFPSENIVGRYGTLTIDSGTATSTLSVNSGDSSDGTLSAITVDGTNLISGTIAYVDNNTTAAAIRTAINDQTGSTGYSASGSGAQINISSSTIPSDSSISLTTSGTINMSAPNLTASTLSAITIDETNLISGTITYSNNNATAEAIRTSINNRTGTTGFTATGSGAQVIINSPTTPLDSNINVTTSGSFGATVSNLSNDVDTDKTTMTTGSLATTIDDGNNNLAQMLATNVGASVGYNLIKGMGIQSASDVRLYSNEQISFRWRIDDTTGGKGDFQAYLVNTANNAFEELKNTTENSSSGWETVTHTVSTSGDYKIAFLAGSYDDDGDGISSARVRVDDVAVSAISDDVLDIIKERVTYENLNFSASNASYTPQVSVTSITGNGSSTTEAIDVPATLAGFSLTGGAGQEVFSTGEVTVLSKDNFSLLQQNEQSNGTSFWETSNATVQTLGVFSGSSPISTSETLRIQNASERIALAIKSVSDYKENYIPRSRAVFEFSEFDTSNYLDSLNTTKADALDVPSAINLSQKTAKMIIADEIQSLLARAGNAVADDVYALIKST
ncbi:MAG: hypothetical protein CML40_09360 [Rhodobacteraceae bacterium]|nr:MAG: hypothetical protein CML40_09360 [Paracoccaceae bacterium]